MAQSFDVLIRGGRVVDGSGNPWFYGDVGLQGDRIAAVAPRGVLDDAAAKETVDAAGHVVCPGFIDIQSHSIVPLLSDGRSLSKVTQGVTTEIMGEAWTPSPFGGRIKGPFDSSLLYVYAGEWAEKAKQWTRFRAWLVAIEQRGVSVNIGSFVGGGTLREYACGWEMRAPTTAEIDTMCRVMDESMRDGAFGVATALIYPPGSFAGTEELIQVARVVGRHGGVYITHVRSEDEKLVESIEEAITIGKTGACAVEIYHLKAFGKKHWHRMPQAIATIERARAQGLDVTATMYPYIGSGTNITVLVPTWAAEGGKLYENLRGPARSRIRSEMAVETAWNADSDAILPVGFLRPENRKYIGQTLGQIARSRGQEWPDAVIDLIISEGQAIFTMYLLMSEKNIRTQVQLPWLTFSTDAGGCDPEIEKNPVHPRAYGTYTRVLGKYVREEKLLSIEEAVRKMSSAVASRLGLQERGMLKTSNFADVVVLDLAIVSDHATFTDTHRLSTGIRDVWVNGTQVLKKGLHTGAMPGRVVDGPGHR